MPRAKINKGKLPDIEVEEIEIYPDGDKTRPRIGVLRFSKGLSRMELDPGMLPYLSMNDTNS